VIVDAAEEVKTIGTNVIQLISYIYMRKS